MGRPWLMLLVFWTFMVGTYTHLVSDFFNNLECCKEILMVCGQLFAPPHCPQGVCTVGIWHSGCIPGQGHTQTQHSNSHRSARFCLPWALFSSPSIYWHLLQQKSCLKHRKPPFCHMRGRARQRAHQCRPLSSSICRLNRKISRKVLKVETLDKKRI